MLALIMLLNHITCLRTDRIAKSEKLQYFQFLGNVNITVDINKQLGCQRVTVEFHF